MHQTDILVVGSEGAGARAAIEASRFGLEVLIVTKGRMARSGATITARADMNLDSRSAKEHLGLSGDPRDSKEAFFEDTLVEGKYLNNQEMVEVLVEEAPLRIRELVDWGMRVYDFVQASGHSYPRGVISPGREIMKALKNEVKRHSNIRILEDVMVLDLLKTDDRVCGAIGLNLRTGELEVVSARSVILATGGGQMVYPMHTAPEELTGDGQAMAWRAGAELIDMEMTQFLAAAFIEPRAWKGVSFPFAISLNRHTMRSWLLNRKGERFMMHWDPVRMENSTRDILSIAVMNEILEGRGSPAGGVYLSFAHLPKNLIDYFAKWYGKPSLKEDWTYTGFKFKELMEQVKDGYAMEVAPASHFFMGGIKVDVNGKTSIHGLYAAGEVSGGLHGANRLSGNAISQILVQGKRAGECAARYSAGLERPQLDNSQKEHLVEKYLAPIKRTRGVNPYEIKRRIHKISWERVGVLRDGEGLRKALEEIEEIERQEIPSLCCTCEDRVYNREWMEALQVENLMLILKAIACSAYERAESRGAHYRKDHPKSDNQKWLKNIVISNEQNEIKTATTPLTVTKSSPPMEAE